MMWWCFQASVDRSQCTNDWRKATSQTQHQVQSRVLADVVVRQRATVLQLLSSEDQSLLVRGDAILVLDLALDSVDGVIALDIQSDGLASQGLDKDLHTTSQTQHQVQGRVLADVVVRQRATVLQLLSSEDQSLLVRGDAILVLDLALDSVDGVVTLDIQSDGLASQGLDEDLHFRCDICFSLLSFFLFFHRSVLTCSSLGLSHFFLRIPLPASSTLEINTYEGGWNW